MLIDSPSSRLFSTNSHNDHNAIACRCYFIAPTPPEYGLLIFHHIDMDLWSYGENDRVNGAIVTEDSI